MPSLRYSVLIRTFNSERTLPHTIRSLLDQTIPPSQFIFVDSGSTDKGLSFAPEGAIIHLYEGDEFNYSSAINQGIKHIACDYVLVISSHTSFQRADAMEFSLGLLASQKTIGAAYFCDEPGLGPRYELINDENFTGFNGVWNTCGVFRSALIKKRNFRPEVYSAEDQEWSQWLFKSEGMAIARIVGGGMSYNNPRSYTLRKWLAEYLSVATFTRPDLKSWSRIARIAYRVIKPNTSLRDRYFHFVLFFGLVSCRFSSPRLKSRYW